MPNNIPESINVIVQVKDSLNSTTSKNINIILKDSPPYFCNYSLMPAYVGENYNYTICAKDSDEDELIYQIYDSPSWLSINSHYGIVG